MPAVDPVSEVWWVYFFVFHGDVQASLSGGYGFELVFQEGVLVEVVVKVEDCEVQSGPFEVVPVVDLEDVTHQIDSELRGQDVTEVQVAGLDLELPLSLQHVLHNLGSVFVQDARPPLAFQRTPSSFLVLGLCFFLALAEGLGGH